MSYAGICYDGPCEGEHRVSELPRFYIALFNGRLEYYGVTRAWTHKHTYRWSFPLRKWVFEW